MERSLLLSALAIGSIGWLYGLLLARSGTADKTLDKIPKTFLFAAIVLPVLVFLATLPSKAPFTGGHGFGNGFLLGGIGALLSGLLLERLRVNGSLASHLRTSAASAAVAAPFSMGLVVTAVSLLWMRQNLLDTLFGIAIGWLATTFVLASGMRPGDRSEPPIVLPLAAGVGFVTTLCTVVALAQFRGNVGTAAAAHAVSWSALGLALAASVPFLLLLSALPNAFFVQLGLKMPLANLFHSVFGSLFQSDDARRSAGSGMRVLFGLLLSLGFAKLLTRSVVGQPHLFTAAWVGLLIGLIVWWVVATRPYPTAKAESGSWHNDALAALVVLTGFMVGYQLLMGIGVGLVLIAAWLPVGFALAAFLETEEGIAVPVSSSEEPTRLQHSASQVLRLALFGVILLVYRLFVTRFEHDLRGVGLTDQYAVFGLLLGAILPGLFASYLLPPNGTSSPAKASLLFRLVLLGAFSVGVPALVLILWGSKCALALLIGLALGAAITRTSEKNDAATSIFPALFALAAALALAQWTHHALPWSLLSRKEKMHILTSVLGSGIVLIMVSDYAGRVRNRIHNSGQGSAASGGATK